MAYTYTLSTVTDLPSIFKSHQPAEVCPWNEFEQDSARFISSLPTTFRRYKAAVDTNNSGVTSEGVLLHVMDHGLMSNANALGQGFGIAFSIDQRKLPEELRLQSMCSRLMQVTTCYMNMFLTLFELQTALVMCLVFRTSFNVVLSAVLVERL